MIDFKSLLLIYPLVFKKSYQIQQNTGHNYWTHHSYYFYFIKKNFGF